VNELPEYKWPTVAEAIAQCGLQCTVDEFMAAFFYTAPTLISFSGGRTSAFMLWCSLVAHGGVLPDFVYVAFANTGKEREETLRFVYECGRRWGVRIYWLEFRSRKVSLPIEDRFENVGFNSASRAGEPFSSLIRDKGFTPNATMRWCTAELKVRVIKWFMQTQGLRNWTNAVGLRHDEKHRVVKSRKPNKEVWTNSMPLDDVRVTNRIVLRFWVGNTPLGEAVRMQRDDPTKVEFYLPQGFDLGLLGFEGNCDGCMLKARAKLWEIERTKPGTLQWWADQETMLDELCAARFGPFRRPVYRIDADDGGQDAKVFDHWEISWPKDGNRFVTEYSYSELIRDVHRQPDMFADVFDADPEMDAECGTWCGEV
jgi:hypothetical protein